jgi:hypothetical protein
VAKFSKAEIGKAIRDAKHHFARQEKPRDPRAPQLPNQRAVGKLFADWMKNSGLDLKALEAHREQGRRERDRAIPQRAAAAAKRWDRHIQVTEADVANQLKHFQAVAPATDFFPSGLLALDTPSAILPSDGIVKSQFIGPQQSFAKILVDRRVDTLDRVSFLFLFRNDFSTPFIYDFLAVHSISGHASMFQDGNPAFSFSMDEGTVTVDVKVEVIPPSDTADSESLMNLRAVALNGPSYWENGNAESTFSHGGFLSANGVILGKSETALILVSVVVDSKIDDGHVVVDMNKGNFGLRCPAVLVVPKRALLRTSYPGAFLTQPLVPL